jgi:hypothetical protein
VKAGAALELSGGITLDEPVALEGGVLRNWSGNNTLKQKLTLNSSSTIDLKQDQLGLSPTTGDAVSVAPASTAYNSNLRVEGLGDLLATGAINLQDGQQTLPTFGDGFHEGRGRNTPFRINGRRHLHRQHICQSRNARCSVVLAHIGNLFGCWILQSLWFNANSTSDSTT